MYMKKTGYLLRLTVIALMLLSAVTFACTAQEMTKGERLKDTLYLQNNNYSAAKDGVLSVIDKEDKTVTPRNRDGVFYVPLRFVLESFGVEVGWDDSIKSVLVTGGEKQIVLSVAEDTISLGDMSEKLAHDCYIDNSHTYVALDDVPKIIKCNVHYYNSGSSAVIAVGEAWDSERQAEKDAYSAMEFAVSPFFKMFT